MPAIFKLSVLSIILPYYGELHEWKKLLDRISKKTKDIWKENSDALAYCGRKFRKEIDIASLNKEDNWRDNLDLYSLTFNPYIFFREIDLRNLVSFLEMLKEDEAIVYSSHRLDIIRYNINFLKEENISDILPAVKCSSFVKEQKMFKISEISNFQEYIKKEMKFKSIVVKLKDEKIIAYSVFSPTLKIYDSYDFDEGTTEVMRKINEVCKVSNWVWRPIKLQIYHEQDIELDLSEDTYSCFERIRDVQIYVREAEESSVQAIFKIIGRFPTWKYEIDIGNVYSEELPRKFIFTGKLLILFIWNKLYAFKREDNSWFQQEIDFNLCSSRNEKWNIISLDINKIWLKDLIIANNITEDTDKEFLDNIQMDISSLEIFDNIWMVTDKKNFILEVEFLSSEVYIPYFPAVSKVIIKVHSCIKESHTCNLIMKYPSITCYKFEIDNPWSEFIKLLSNPQFVKKLKELKVEIVWKGVEIQVKYIIKEMMTNFIDKLKEDIRNKSFGIK